ncbi:MAG: glycerol-3-phosphate acyltransferase [Clostridia bacterium]|nr:glycerol-3-phosphate acyltransferase [Clostridia bacterium]
MSALGCILLGYLIGGINPAYLIGRRRGFDIRKRGSGNAGASNAVIVMGKKVGVLSALFDIFKSFLTVRLSAWLFPTFAYATILAGVACILGHMYPVFLGFRGGKGLACLGGMILAYDWAFFLALLSSELILVLIVDYICVVPITASIIFPVVYALRSKNLIGTLILLVSTFFILLKHIENLKRIRKGTEAHFSFLWKRDQEIERLMGDSSAKKQ